LNEERHVLAGKLRGRFEYRRNRKIKSPLAHST
jgi:hypothetical protein